MRSVSSGSTRKTPNPSCGMLWPSLSWRVGTLVMSPSLGSMKLLVLGATGKTGQLVLAAARRAGHDLTVLVRDPARLPSTDGLTVLTGDASSAADVTRASSGQDAVISVVGGGYSTTTDIASRTAKALAA